MSNGQLRGVASKRLLVYLAAALFTTLVLYVRSLALPFYSDDLVQIPWLRGLGFRELWGRVSPYGYYRPLAFSVWLAVREMGFAWTPAGLRLLNLVMHVIAAGLAGWLALEVDPERRSLSGLFAAVLFAAYPFAYQAVPWVSAFFYPLVVGLTLLAVIAYLRARRERSRAWLAVSLLAAALAPFAHENGALVGLLVLLAELLIWLQAQRRGETHRWSAAVVGPVAISTLYLLWWLSLREEGISTFDFSVAGLAQNAAILSIGLSHPLAWIAGIARPAQVVLVWGLALLTVVLLVWLTRRDVSVGLFCAGWFLISIGPVLITMRPNWLIDAPRFLYPAGVGASMWWGIALGGLASEDIRSRALAAGLALLVGLPGAIFVWQGVGWHLRGGTAIWDAVEIAQTDPGQSLLLVNLPDRLAPARRFYPFFDGGAILLPPQVTSGDIVGSHTGETRDDLAITAGHILPPVDYTRTTYGELAAPDQMDGWLMSGPSVLVADYSKASLQIREAGQRLENYSLPQRTGIAYFDSTMILWEAEPQVDGGWLRLRLVWEITTEPRGDLTVFVHVVDTSGAIAAQGDGDPMGGVYPLREGVGHALLEDIRYIPLPGGGPYTINVGVWNPAEGTNLPAAGGDYPDGRVPLGTIP